MKLLFLFIEVETSIEVECKSSTTLRNQEEEEHSVDVSGVYACCVISHVEQFRLLLILALLRWNILLMNLSCKTSAII